MFIPDSYKNENQEEIRAFLVQNSFGTLVNQTNGKLCATRIS
jgi:transcriptional regulator